MGIAAHLSTKSLLERLVMFEKIRLKTGIKKNIIGVKFIYIVKTLLTLMKLLYSNIKLHYDNS